MKLKNFLKLYVDKIDELITIAHFDWDEFKDKAEKFEVCNIPENYLNARVKYFGAFNDSISIVIDL